MGSCYSCVEEIINSSVVAPPSHVTIHDLRRVGVIGRGGFSEVWKCVHKLTGVVYAVKVMSKCELQKPSFVARVCYEVAIGTHMRNPSIVRVFGAYQDSMLLYMIQEFCPRGDLLSVIMRYPVFNIPVTKQYMAELAAAIGVVHSHHIVHRDIKPDNILIDAKGHIKLADFGLCGSLLQTVTTSSAEANTMYSSIRRRSVVGTPSYMAVEIIQGMEYDYSCDWWSFGIVMYECLCGYAPFTCDKYIDTWYKIAKWEQYLKYPDDMDKTAHDLLVHLLCPPNQRFSLSQIMQHEFFHGINWATLHNNQAVLLPVECAPVLDLKYCEQFDMNKQPDAAYNNAYLGYEHVNTQW